MSYVKCWKISFYFKQQTHFPYKIIHFFIDTKEARHFLQCPINLIYSLSFLNGINNNDNNDDNDTDFRDFDTAL